MAEAPNEHRADNMSIHQVMVQTDQATAQDGLSFDSYRRTLVEVIRFAQAPLTIGIFGKWGSGKTSLLLMLQQSLKEAQDEPHARLVWFNAWQYGQEAALWRALLSRVLEALKPAPSKGEQTESEATKELRRQLEDLQASLYRDVDREETGAFEIDWDKLTKGGLKGAVKFGLSYIPGGRLLDDLVKAAGGKADTWAEEVLGAFQREKTRIHLDHVQFLEQFREKFEALVKKHVVEKKERLVVFVDDLDRCLPEKAIEALEAIKLFLDVDGCVFVIAVDRDVIVEGIRVRYRDFALRAGGEEELPIKGADYLEKIIQLPFYLPPVSRDDMVTFIIKEAADLPPGCAEVFSLGIETNPRKIKRALNVFWMHNRLAEHRQELKAVIKPVRLAKVVVIQNRYPELYRDWMEAPLLLRHLEERFLAEAQWEAASAEQAKTPGGEIHKEAGKGLQLPAALDSELVRKWAHLRLRPLGRMLLFGINDEDQGFSGMAQKDLEAYIYLTSTATVIAPATDEQLIGKAWEDLLSRDQTRLQSAAGRIQPEEKQGYTGRLLRFFRNPGSPLEQRASAGDALALLGDPRFDPNRWYLPDEPLLGFIEIPKGRFRMGTPAEEIEALVAEFGGEKGYYEPEMPQFELELDTYYLARYPVTAAQFRAFVEDSKYQPADPDSLNDLPSRPARWVSWYEALEYCRWLEGKLRLYAQEQPEGQAGQAGFWQGLSSGALHVTLPSEAEWEKAARGADGRNYPWGDNWDASLCNADETGIGDTSAVGCFPAGASPYGLQDLSGNV